MELDSYKYAHFSITKNKNLDFQLSRWKYSPKFDIDLWIRRAQDHGGVDFNLILFGYEFNITFYDTRHWDRENNCYESEM